MPCEGYINAPQEPSATTHIGVLYRSKVESYRCRHCGFMTQKDNAKTSGYNSEHSLRHIHCPSCGRIVAWPSEGIRLRGMVEGTFLTIVGGALALTLYPFLNVYGLQAGLFTSLYGLLKIMLF